MQDAPALILFDGVCNLCNAWVNFVIDHDANGYFKFASLQSDIGRRHVQHHHVTQDSIVLVEDGTSYTASTAVLRIARKLGGPWALLYSLAVIPRPLRDVGYRWVARNRYRWFGEKNQCRLPTPELRTRFVE